MFSKNPEKQKAKLEAQYKKELEAIGKAEEREKLKLEKLQKKETKKVIKEKRVIEKDRGKTVTELDPTKAYVEAKVYDYFSLKGIKRYFERKKYRKNPDRFVMVRMRTANDVCVAFIVEYDPNGFYFDGGRYIFDLSKRYYDKNSKIFCFDYQVSIDLPYKQEIIWAPELRHALDEYIADYKKHLKKPLNTNMPVNKIFEIMRASKEVQIDNAFDPVTMEKYQDSNMIQALVSAIAMGKLFRIILILLIIVLIIAGINMAVSLSESEQIRALFDKG